MGRAILPTEQGTSNTYLKKHRIIYKNQIKMTYKILFLFSIIFLPLSKGRVKDMRRFGGLSANFTTLHCVHSGRDIEHYRMKTGRYEMPCTSPGHDICITYSDGRRDCAKNPFPSTVTPNETNSCHPVFTKYGPMEICI